MHNYVRKKVGIVGARGYSGLDLARILLRHPGAELVACFAGESAFKLSDYLPESAAVQVKVLPLAELEQHLPELDFVFLATPAEVSIEITGRILDAKHAKTKVIDLSGAFRLEADAYPEWYKLTHPRKDLLEQAAFGLCPFAPPAGNTRLIANPGCYATAALMGIIPLLQHKLVQPKSIVVDAKSGTSGAGRKAAENILFTEVEGECLPYKVGKHQHLPEIRRYAEAFGGQAIDPFFTTHLLPVRRGIIAGIYAELVDGITEQDVAKAFFDTYRSYPLVSVGAIGAHPAWGLSLKKVVGTARTHLLFQVVGKKLYLFSLLDNLLKGAASQAVENFNRMSDFPIGLALTELEGTL